MTGYQMGHIYEHNGRFLICVCMDFQKMKVEFLIFETLDEAKNWRPHEARN